MKPVVQWIVAIALTVTVAFAVASMLSANDAPVSITEPERYPLYELFLERELLAAKIVPLQAEYDRISASLNQGTTVMFDAYGIDRETHVLDLKTGRFIERLTQAQPSVADEVPNP